MAKILSILVIGFLVLSGCRTSRSVEEGPITEPENERRVAELNELLKKDPSNTEHRYDLVRIYLDEQFFDLAISELKTITEIQPQQIEAYILLGICLSEPPKFNRKDAIETLERAKIIAPDDAEVRLHLAKLHAIQNENAQAKAEAQKAIELSSDPELKDLASSILSIVDGDPQNASGSKTLPPNRRGGGQSTDLKPIEEDVSYWARRWGRKWQHNPLLDDHGSPIKRAKVIDKATRNNQ